MRKYAAEAHVLAPDPANTDDHASSRGTDHGGAGGGPGRGGGGSGFGQTWLPNVYAGKWQEENNFFGRGWAVATQTVIDLASARGEQAQVLSTDPADHHVRYPPLIQVLSTDPLIIVCAMHPSYRC